MNADPELSRAMALQRRGDFPAAMRVYEQILKQRPEHPMALHYLGLASFQSGQLPRAHDLIKRSLAFDSSRANGWSDLGMVLARQGKLREALPAFSRALQIDATHADALNNMGTVLKQMHRDKEALPLFERLTALYPDSARAWRNLGDVRYQINDVPAAIQAYRRAVQLAPADSGARIALGDAWESLGEFDKARLEYGSILEREPDDPRALSKLIQLGRADVDANWIERAQSVVGRPDISSVNRVRLHVALGYHFDRAKAFDMAFEHLKLAYDEQFGKDPFDSDGYSRAIDSLIEVFSGDFLRNAGGSGSGSERPIFIVGMPRSGTTLVEQILSSHSRVAGGGELSMMLQVSYQTRSLSSSRTPYPYGIRDVDSNGLGKMAERYLDHLQGISATADRVTDKLPFNFMHLGLVAMIFPNARIIHCRRDPMDNCLSCYFTSFADKIQFANNLGTLGRYYVDYHRLMSHWNRVLPGRLLNLSYEKLVADTEMEIRRLLEHCGLEWEDACLRFHETQRGVRTPSRWQVRQPIYSQSVERWRNYEAHLQPLQHTLAPVLSGRDAAA